MTHEYKYKLSLVIPVFGGEHVLPELVKQINSVLSNINDIKNRCEIIFVCDNSPDNSWQIIQSLFIEFPHVKGILLRMNAGQHNAIMAGLAKAQGEIIVTMDDDLQHSPCDIPKLLEKIKQGYDVAYACFKKRKHSFLKVAGSRFNNIVASFLLRKPREIYLSPFRAMKSVIRDEILQYRGPFVYIDGLILTVTPHIASVDVDHHERYAGDSAYTFRKSLSLWLKMSTNFSIVPLRITSFIGILFSGLGFLFAILLIIQKLTWNLMPIGWSSLIVTILIIGGAQLLAIGMLGEYLGRVLLTLNAKPQYVIAETVGLQN